MNNSTLYIQHSQDQQFEPFSEEIRTEIIRKTIHMLIAFVPLTSQLWGSNITLALLLGGTLVYIVAESLRFRNYNVPIISNLTRLSSRSGDKKSFIIAPITLSVGTGLALFIFPEPVASIAIYTLAFGDGISSVFGKIFRSKEVPFSGGKTVAGSVSCFIVVFLSCFAILRNPLLAFVIAGAATFLETLPMRNLDNILLPLGSGFIAFLLI